MPMPSSYSTDICLTHADIRLEHIEPVRSAVVSWRANAPVLVVAKHKLVHADPQHRRSRAILKVHNLVGQKVGIFCRHTSRRRPCTRRQTCQCRHCRCAVNLQRVRWCWSSSKCPFWQSAHDARDDAHADARMSVLVDAAKSSVFVVLFR